MEELAAEMEERHGVTTVVLPKDLSEPHAAADVMANLEERGVRVDALVNNAGFSTYGPLVDTDLDATMDMLRVNMLTLTELTRRCLPGMIERGWGRVLNLGSIGSFSPAPMTAAYAGDEGVRALALAGPPRRAEGHRRHGDRPVPRARRRRGSRRGPRWPTRR